MTTVHWGQLCKKRFPASSARRSPLGHASLWGIDASPPAISIKKSDRSPFREKPVETECFTSAIIHTATRRVPHRWFLPPHLCPPQSSLFTFLSHSPIHSSPPPDRTSTAHSPSPPSPFSPLPLPSHLDVSSPRPTRSRRLSALLSRHRHDILHWLPADRRHSRHAPCFRPSSHIDGSPTPHPPIPNTAASFEPQHGQSCCIRLHSFNMAYNGIKYKIP